ncbi:hypothetical protein KY289_013915 [Solanum tuberosum]|nr:hypothetical protein KY289_013915 [Solanum tuberosum]
MTTTQSFISVASSSNIKCSFCLCEECEQQYDYFISRVKELTDIFKEMPYNIDEKEEEEKEKEQEKEEEEEEEKENEKEKEKVKVKKKAKEKEKEKEKEQEKEKEREKVKKKAKEKVKKKAKKVEVVNCDVKQQFPFEGFNIDGEGPSELISSFSQWINEGLYKHHAKK